jgi:outer membrane protein assembly factor BamB
MLSGRCVAWRHFACATALLCAMTAPGCSGGDGDDSTTPAPPWGRFRRDSTNSGVGLGGVGRNPGKVRWSISLSGVTQSTPVIGLNETIYVGTQAGLLAIDRSQGERKYTDPLEKCGEVDVGPINGSPAVTVNNDIIVGNDNGYVFLIHDDGIGLECKWAFSSATGNPSLGGDLRWMRSSPLTSTDPFDFRLIRAFLGSLAGTVQALNGNGTEQWRFQSSDPSFGPLSASPASDGTLLYISAPDGVLYAVDSSGRQRWRATAGLPQPNAELLASPVVGSLVYAAGAIESCEAGGQRCEPASQITAFGLDGAFRWSFDSLSGSPIPPVPGSPALVVQSVDERAPETPIPPDSSDPPPTPTPTRLVPVAQEVVYLVDRAATIYALRGSSGQPFDIFQPATTSTPTATPTPTPEGTPPQQDTRSPTPAGTPVTAKRSVVRLQTAGAVTTSPTISADLFVLFGTTDGRLYAVRVDFDRTEPCTQGCSDPDWISAASEEESDGTAGAFVALPGAGAIRSSPVIDRDGTIYVTADPGFIYAIGTEPE